MNIKSYHNLDALGSSDIRAWINSCPSKWMHRKENIKSSDAMTFGQLVHTMLLEPEKFDEEFAINPHDSFRTKVAKEWKKEMLEKGLIIVDDKMINKAEQVRNQIMSHQGAKMIFSGNGKNEQDFFWEDELTGIQLKYRPDRVTGTGDNMAIVDLKTTVDASPNGFLKSIEKYQYWIQAGFYAKGFIRQYLKMPKYFFIVAVETTFPYEVAVYEICQDDILLGIEIVNRALKDIKKTLDSQEYLGYNKKDEFTTLRVSNWVRSQFEEGLNE